MRYMDMTLYKGPSSRRRGRWPLSERGTDALGFLTIAVLVVWFLTLPQPWVEKHGETDNESDSKIIDPVQTRMEQNQKSQGLARGGKEKDAEKTRTTIDRRRLVDPGTTARQGSGIKFLATGARRREAGTALHRYSRRRIGGRITVSGRTHPVPSQAADAVGLHADSNQWVLRRMRVTAYCPGRCCCGRYADGVTASGKSIHYNGGKFAAGDKKFKFGTVVRVPGYNGGRAIEIIDRGGAIKGDRLDLFFSTHNAAIKWGKQYLDVQIRRTQ